jgi:hypothetical protein
MKTKIIFRTFVLLTLLANMVILFTSCQTEDPQNNGLTDANVDASFTITPVAGVSNKYVLNVNSKNILGSKWNLGDGSADYIGKITNETVFLPDAGEYKITHTAIGKGGTTNTTSQNIVVPVSDPVAGNLIKGGKFLNSTEHSQWTILNISNNSATKWNFNDGSATISGGSWNQQGIFQALTVEANKKYKIDMQVSGSGSKNTWFEVYASSTPPVQNSDYTADGRRVGLSTWDGCANNSFSGKLSELKCVGSGNIVSFSESGTIYFVIKSGGEDIGTSGIKITNVEIRGIK